MPQMPCPLLQPRHEGAHPDRHAVDGAEDAAVPSGGCSQASAERIPWKLTSDSYFLIPSAGLALAACQLWTDTDSNEIARTTIPAPAKSHQSRLIRYANLRSQM